MRLFDKLFRYEAIDLIFSDSEYIQSLLDFEAAGCYLLRLRRLAVKDFPHGLNALFLRTATHQD